MRAVGLGRGGKQLSLVVGKERRDIVRQWEKDAMKRTIGLEAGAPVNIEY